MTQIRVAIVGAGYMAHEHAKALAAQPNVKIVGVVGRRSERAQALARLYGATVYNDIASMHAGTQAQAVVVAVNELATRAVCEQIFAFPWTSLIEKPVGIDLQEARAISSLAMERNAKAYVAFNRRSYAATLAARDQLGENPNPRLISVLDQQDIEAAAASGQPDAVVANYMFANSIHLVDYFTLFGRGTVLAVRNIARWTPDKPAMVVASIHFSSGDLGLYQAIWNGPGPWSVTVTNSSVRTELRPLEKLSTQHRGERRLVEIPADPIDTQFKPGLHRQAQQFCLAVRHENSDLCDLATGLRSMDLCARIYGLADETAR